MPHGGRHYAALIRANEGLSAMLRSAVDVDIDTDAIRKVFSDFLRRAGETGADISELEETLEDIRARLSPPNPSPPNGSGR